ncbi:MAG: ATP-binding cassette domain-containing protein [Candidatus Pacebacteria bacterium]|nr:ATP-binding cassette domain-containing protein [Candidatus Paceibacterota bacterium]
MNDSNPLLELSGLAVRYGELYAIKGIDLSIFPGEIHGVMGDNGAGKSTLVKVMAGIVRPSAGRIVWQGRAVKQISPAVARGLGIAWVDQNLSLFDGLTVAQNLALVRSSRESLPWPKLPPPPIHLGSDQRVATLNTEQKQLLAIEMALAGRPQMLILDEPTTSLTPLLRDWLQGVIRTLAESGCAIVMISHRRSDLSPLIQTASYLQAGRLAHRWRRGEDESRLYPPLMEPQAVAKTSNPQRPILDLDWQGKNWQIMAGTITGFVFSEAATAQDFFNTIGNLSNGLRQMIGLRRLPSPQSGGALALGLGLVENIQITADDSLSRLGWLRIAAARRLVRAIKAEAGLGIQWNTQPVNQLSGGNRQKLALLRELLQNPQILILQQPLNGLDRQVSQTMAKRLRLAQSRGMTIIVTGFNRDEVAPFCDRIFDV